MEDKIIPNFSIDGRMKDLPDIQRAFMFELLIPDLGDWKQEDMIVRCKTASIPARGNAPIESVFMGMKQYFPGQPLFTNVLTVEIEEHEDQKALKALYDWQQQIFDVDPFSPTAGQSKQPTDNAVSRDITLRMYRYNGQVLEKSIKFYNSWLENVDESALAYTTNDSVRYTASFRYDYWLLQDN